MIPEVNLQDGKCFFFQDNAGNPLTCPVSCSAKVKLCELLDLADQYKRTEITLNPEGLKNFARKQCLNNSFKKPDNRRKSS